MAANIADAPARSGTLTRTVLAIGAVLSGVELVRRLLRRTSQRSEARHVDKLRDKAIKDSFPASDPPASQFFDIPVNRQ